MIAKFAALYRFRGFIFGSVRREFEARYRNSLLGALWAVLHPLAMIIIYTVVFSHVMRAKLPGIDGDYAYSIYLCSGVLTWNLFAEITGRAQNVFLEHANLIKKLNFPRICLPIIVILNAAINFFIVFTLFVLFLLLSGHFPGWVFVGVFPVFLVQVLFAIGLGVALGVLNVFFRDVGQFFGLFLQFWFWLTPIVYPASILPESVARWVAWNPMTPLIGAYQRIFVQHAWPDWASLLPVTLLSLFLCTLAWRLFRRRAGEMVDEL